MNKRLLALSAGLLASCIANAAIITTSTDAPTDFLSDAFSATEGSAYLLSSARTPVGQSFTHTTSGGEAWQLRSITFRSYDTTGASDEDASGMTMDIYTGTSVALANKLESFSFTTGTFDATENNYLTFALTSAESTALGNLTSGATYTIALSTTDAGGFRIDRSGANSYDGGQAFFNGSVQSADTTFWVASIPEPSSFAQLAGLTGLGFVMVRRRK
ncbi:MULTISPECIES: hypothetical protein [unclassified Lentimonas]|uniref:hypothetical protein n=1 Tax=unclassified Lentimonas TaxID=2630993 RepID=UPI001327797C|nr:MULTISPECIES: hypothetical protein [unclassified Lentimonas]CAA6677752.1 Unannotated [Lentimonas sp. CC4]CAA6685016.1 Unannotated [Lentimonas sp. CC6]CAA7077866.1 Unannotated [Lentimonas sp. CC4]CAA7169794.1 Unannotated [Lentimonas sp. CC21]CAA7179912.1 Unannotated [Lentimonas sp. CC8]